MAGTIPPQIQQAIFFPDDALRLQQAQAQQAYAQALMQKGLGPAPQGQQAGQVYIPPSWTQQLAHALNPAMGAYMNKQAITDQSEINQRMGQKYADMLKGVFGGGQQEGGSNPQFSANMSRAQALKLLGMDDMALESLKQAGEWNKPTSASLAATQGGVDPGLANRTQLFKDQSDPKVYGMLTAGMTPEQIKQAFYGQAAKDAEIDRKPESQFLNPVLGQAGMVPKIPDYANPVGQPAPNGALPGGVTPLPGAVPIAANTAGAVKGAQEANSIGTVTGPDGSQVPAWMGPAARVGGAQLGLTGGGGGARPPAMPAPGGQPPQAPQQPQQPRLGVPTGVPQQIEATQKRWSELQAQNSEAGNTKAYLSSIKQYADKAATGQFTDKLQFTNSILGLIGNEKATDATTANNLLDKYSNQIVARLGQNGLGTDAARSILQSAYPNAKMTPQAIKEAADNLIGAQDMVQAKTRFLEKHGNARDAVNYQQAERAFDQAADPRLFQLKNMDAQAAQRFLQSLPPQAQAELRQKAATLKQLGVF